MNRQRATSLCLVLAACLLALPAAAPAKDLHCARPLPAVEPRAVNVVNAPNVAVVNTPSVNVANQPAVTVPDGVAIINTPSVAVANVPGVVVVNDAASPIPVVVQNQPQGAAASEVAINNGADRPVPVRQASTYYSVFLRGSIPNGAPTWSVYLNWPQDKAFLVKSVVLWTDTRVSLFFPVASTTTYDPNGFIWVSAQDTAGRPAVANVEGGILLQETGISCRFDKLEPDGATARQFRLLVTGELLPK